MSDVHFSRDDYYMRLALREAERATRHGDVPIGAAILRDGDAPAAAGNERELRREPTAHAEILAIRAAAEPLARLAPAGHDPLRHPRALRDVRRGDRPRPHPAGRLRRPDPKAGAAGTLYNICQDDRLNHCLEMTAGLLADESAALLRQFFQARR